MFFVVAGTKFIFGKLHVNFDRNYTSNAGHIDQLANWSINPFGFIYLHLSINPFAFIFLSLWFFQSIMLWLYLFPYWIRFALWLQVHFKFELMQETLYLMVTLLDQYLSQVQIKKNQMQLVGLTALLLASKYEDFWHPRVKMISQVCTVLCESFLEFYFY